MLEENTSDGKLVQYGAAKSALDANQLPPYA